MRPLSHPSIDDVTVEGILHALADPERVMIYAEIIGAQAACTCTAMQEASNREIPKSTLSQHFHTLREAGLIHSERKGVEMLNTSRCDELEKRFPGLVRTILSSHLLQHQQRRPSAKRRRA